MPPESKYLPEQDREKHFTFIDRQLRDHPVVKCHHARWKELIAWENGDQFSEWNPTQQKMTPVELKRRTKRVIVNIMKPVVETIEGKINFVTNYIGVPNSSEMKDIEGSKVATKLLSHNNYVVDIDTLNEDLKYDFFRTGNACRRFTFEKGTKGVARLDGGGVEEVDGEVVGFVPSIFNIRPDPTAKTVKDCRWFIEYAEVTRDAISEAYPEITSEELDAVSQGDDKSGNKYTGLNEKREEKDLEEETFIVAYYWERKSKKWPEGRLIISTGNLLLWANDNPALGNIPFELFGYKRYGNSIWHTGPLHHIQDIQRETNRMISIISEHIEAWRPKLVAHPESIIKDGAFTVDSFEILECDLSHDAPRPLIMPELSPQVMNQRDFMIAMKDLVSNVHEVSYSQLPQYATRSPASLYGMMLEQEDLKITPMVRRINAILLSEGKKRLMLMEKYYDQNRLVKVVGPDSAASIQYWNGADLNGNMDVKLAQGVSIHQSKIVMQKLLLEFKNAGAPIEWDKIYKLIQDQDIEQELRGDISDQSRASRENQTFLNKQYEKEFSKGGVKVYMHDNHEIHMEYHTNLRKSEEAQGWDQKTLDALDLHINEHYMFIQLVAQQQAMAGAQTPGGPAGPGSMTQKPALPGAPGMEGEEGNEAAGGFE